MKKMNESDLMSIKERGERAARRKIIEELFYDFYKSRYQVYWINFVRGLFLGFGTILGGTVFIALLIWILSMVAGWFPGLGQYLDQIIKAIQNSK